MKVEAYKSDNGFLFETEQECRIENVRVKIVKFLLIKEDSATYTQIDAYRSILAKEIAEKIINEKDQFLALFSDI